MNRLPPELLDLIVHHLPNARSVARLSSTSRRYKNLSQNPRTHAMRQAITFLQATHFTPNQRQRILRYLNSQKLTFNLTPAYFFQVIVPLGLIWHG